MNLIGNRHVRYLISIYISIALVFSYSACQQQQRQHKTKQQNREYRRRVGTQSDCESHTHTHANNERRTTSALCLPFLVNLFYVNKMEIRKNNRMTSKQTKATDRKTAGLLVDTKQDASTMLTKKKTKCDKRNVLNCAPQMIR